MPTTMTVQKTVHVREIGRPTRFAFVLGTSCVVLGGLVAAVTEPLAVADGSWLAAYLVLVGGVAQCAITGMPLWLAARPISTRLNWTELACWNLGNALVIIGVLTDLPWFVDFGGVALLIGLGIAWHAARRGTKPGRATRFTGPAYRCLLLLLLISIPIGAALAHSRALT